MTRPGGAQVAAGLCKELLTPSFFDEHWERCPKHLQGRPEANLLPEALGVDDVAALIRRSGPSLKMFKKGTGYDDESFLHAYLDGCSLIVNQADRYHPVIYDLCQGLAGAHFHHVFGVVYLTPPNSQAVRLHNDDQDVFLLQVWGRKHWTIRNAPRLLPYTEEMLGKSSPVPEELVGAPVMSFDMQPHDVLFIPRGFLHEAQTSDESSLHVTITVPTSDYCWGVQLAKHLAQSLPPAACEASLRSADLEEQLQELLRNWQEGLSAETVVQTFERRMEGTNVGQERAFRQAMGLRMRPSVTERSRVRLMHGVLLRCEADRAVFLRESRSLDLPVATSALPLLRSLTPLPQRVSELPCGDRFERLCVLEILHQLGALQLFLEDDRPQSVEIML